jgi:hypothetical protein
VQIILAEHRPRIVSWFSCGAASAIASYLAVCKYGERCEVVYCDTAVNEHPDNERFVRGVRVFLDELPEDYLPAEPLEDISCGPECGTGV